MGDLRTHTHTHTPGIEQLIIFARRFLFLGKGSNPLSIHFLFLSLVPVVLFFGLVRISSFESGH